MTKRTTQTIIDFTSPFLLPSFDTRQPAGRYRIDYDEEMIEGATRLAWRRVGAFVFLPAVDSPGLTRQMVPLSMTDLSALLDTASAASASPSAPET